MGPRVKISRSFLTKDTRDAVRSCSGRVLNFVSASGRDQWVKDGEHRLFAYPAHSTRYYLLSNGTSASRGVEANAVTMPGHSFLSLADTVLA